METGFMNRIIGLVLALVVGGLLVGGLLIPSIEGITATEKTFENTGYYYMTDVGADESYTYEFVSTPSKAWTVNGEALTFPEGAYNVIVTDEHFVRSNGQIEGNSIASMTVTVTAESITGTYTAAGVSHDIDWAVDGFYGAVPTKDSFIMTDPDGTTYVNSDTEVIGFGISNLSGQYPIFHIVGDMENVTVTSPDTTVTIDNIAINKTAVGGYIDLYKFDSITFDATKGANTATITYNRVILPTEVTAELSNHLDATQIAMFGVISILGIVALVVVAANGIRNKY